MTTREKLADALRQCDGEMRSATVLHWSWITPAERSRWLTMADAAIHVMEAADA